MTQNEVAVQAGFNAYQLEAAHSDNSNVSQPTNFVLMMKI